MSAEALAAARHLYARAIDKTDDAGMPVFATAELLHATGDAAPARRLVAMEPQILAHIAETGWPLASVLDRIPDAGFKAASPWPSPPTRRSSATTPAPILPTASPTSPTSGAPAGTSRSA